MDKGGWANPPSMDGLDKKVHLHIVSEAATCRWSRTDGAEPQTILPEYRSRTRLLMTEAIWQQIWTLVALLTQSPDDMMCQRGYQTPPIIFMKTVPMHDCVA